MLKNKNVTSCQRFIHSKLHHERLDDRKLEFQQKKAITKQQVDELIKSIDKLLSY